MRRQYLQPLREHLLDHDLRIRVTLDLERGRLVAWAVQLEWWDPEEGRWVWVARYDGAGGRVHRDRNRIAPHEPAPFASTSGTDLRAAKEELRRNALAYIEAYRAAKAQGREAWP